MYNTFQISKNRRTTILETKILENIIIRIHLAAPLVVGENIALKGHIKRSYMTLKHTYQVWWFRSHTISNMFL